MQILVLVDVAHIDHAWLDACEMSYYKTGAARVLSNIRACWSLLLDASPPRRSDQCTPAAGQE